MLEFFYFYYFIQLAIYLLVPIVIILVIWRVFRNMRSGAALVQNPWAATQLFIPPLENLLIQIFLAQAMQQIQRATELRQTMETEISSLPPRKQEVYRRRLSDVVSGRTVLNRNMEWENG